MMHRICVVLSCFIISDYLGSVRIGNALFVAQSEPVSEPAPDANENTDANENSLEALKQKIRQQLATHVESSNPKSEDLPRARLSAYAPPAHAHIHKTNIGKQGVGGQVMDEQTINEHKEDFTYFDLNKDGYVDAEEMRVVFVEMGDVAAMEEMMQFFEDVDDDSTGTISWDEYYQYALLTSV